MSDPPSKGSVSPESGGCPKCSFSGWKAAALVHREGTTSGTTAYRGVGVGADGDGLGVSIHSGQADSNFQSLQSKLAEPPALKAKVSSGAFVLCVLMALGGAYLLVTGHFGWGIGLLILGVGAFMGNKQLAKDDKEAKAKYLKDVEEYERTRMCLRCGTFYVAAME